MFQNFWELIGILNPKPITHNPKPDVFHDTFQNFQELQGNQNPKPKTQNPKPKTQNPKPDI
jgi:hypothetical protein